VEKSPPRALEAMTSSPSPTFEIDADRIGWITFDDPDRSLNVLTEAVMLRFGETLDEARAAAREGRLTALVLRSGKPNSFIAGADIDVIATVEDPARAEETVRVGQSIYNDVASLPVPTVAAIHGVCVGGGVEMALACDHRVLTDSKKTSMSLPEVQLGILPAWGGTTRLPRLVGLQAALDMLLTGKKVNARKARRIGLATEVVPAGSQDDGARALIGQILQGKVGRAAGKRSLLNRLLDETPPGRRIVLGTARKKVMATTGGHYPAPLRILDILAAHLGGSVEESLAAEAREAAQLLVSPVCKNLVHVFHMREAARKGTGLERTASAGAAVEPRPVRAMGVLGAGVMGGGVAQLAASRGISVYMKDIRHEAVTGGLQHARSLFDKAVQRRRMTHREAAQAQERISGGLEVHGLSNADLVIEDIVEKMDVKKAVLRETEAHVSADCVLATNTSSLSVAEMATALERPDRFCGMHFFNPVHRMPLVEVIRGPETSDETVVTVYRLSVELGKVPVVVGDGPGFLVNRILGPYLNEAGFLLEEFRSVDEIDRIAKAFGMPMGPLRLIDEVGIDVSGHAGASLHEGLGDRLAPAPLLLALGGTDRLGRKGGLGFYRYDKGKDAGVDPDIYAALGLSGASSSGGEEARREEIIRRRLVLAMINEAARILDDGIVTAAQDVDLAMIMGTGFPTFRGGLLRFADTLHPRGIVARLEELQQQVGARFEPSPLLQRLASEDRTFYDAFPGTVGGRRSV
jgi:3-hydroxyacyl-CoA dehydrogenase/enoyl-CoA hydratase/3-hydroxybutyryl-CoA epimerase